MKLGGAKHRLAPPSRASAKKRDFRKEMESGVELLLVIGLESLAGVEPQFACKIKLLLLLLFYGIMTLQGGAHYNERAAAPRWKRVGRAHAVKKERRAACQNKRSYRRRKKNSNKNIDNAPARAAYGVRYAGNNDVSGPSMCYNGKVFVHTRVLSYTHAVHFLLVLLFFFRHSILRLHFAF